MQANIQFLTLGDHFVGHPGKMHRWDIPLLYYEPMVVVNCQTVTSKESVQTGPGREVGHGWFPEVFEW